MPSDMTIDSIMEALPLAFVPQMSLEGDSVMAPKFDGHVEATSSRKDIMTHPFLAS